MLKSGHWHLIGIPSLSQFTCKGEKSDHTQEYVFLSSRLQDVCLIQLLFQSHTSNSRKMDNNTALSISYKMYVLLIVQIRCTLSLGAAFSDQISWLF